MKKKNVSRICLSLLMGTSICMSSVSMAFAAENAAEAEVSAETEASESTEGEGLAELDLTAFCTDGEYRYKGIPWLASLEEAEETLGVSLEPMMEGMNTKMGSFVAPTEFQGEAGFMGLGFLQDGVTDISFWFGADSNNKDKYDGDLTELSDYVLEQFTELYGEPAEAQERTLEYGEIFKSYQWQEVKDGNVNTVLNIQCTDEGSGGRMYSLAVGAVGREATIQVKKEIGEIPEDFEAETAETSEEAEIPAEKTE